jgi:hypothetical protein
MYFLAPLERLITFIFMAGCKINEFAEGQRCQGLSTECVRKPRGVYGEEAESPDLLNGVAGKASKLNELKLIQDPG